MNCDKNGVGRMPQFRTLLLLTDKVTIAIRLKAH